MVHRHALAARAYEWNARRTGGDKSINIWGGLVAASWRHIGYIMFLTGGPKSVIVAA